MREDRYDEVRKGFKFTDGGWNKQSPKLIEKFLSKWFERKVKLILFMEYCNASSGFPVWRIDYCFKDEEKK